MWTAAVAYISSFNIWSVRFSMSTGSALSSSSLIMSKEWWSFSADYNCLIKISLSKALKTAAVWSGLSEGEELESAVND